MGIQIAIHYRNKPVTYDVTVLDDKIYQLRWNGFRQEKNDDYIPEKIVIRRKGKIWVSDMDNHEDLMSVLTEEIKRFDPETERGLPN
jgi:hypothetical protein